MAQYILNINRIFPLSTGNAVSGFVVLGKAISLQKYHIKQTFGLVFNSFHLFTWTRILVASNTFLSSSTWALQIWIIFSNFEVKISRPVGFPKQFNSSLFPIFKNFSIGWSQTVSLDQYKAVNRHVSIQKLILYDNLKI